MPTVPAKCPECGEIIQADNEKDAAICPHCSMPFIVKKAVSNYFGAAEQHDFQIRAGVLIKYTGAAGDVLIPNNVTAVGQEAFKNCTVLYSVKIPDGVASIGDAAFSGCSSLTEISIPNSVASIGNEAFMSCRSLTEISIPPSVTSIGDWAFYDCCELTEITIPNSVTSIGKCALGNCSRLRQIRIPDGITSIKDWTFWNCSGLTEITIPENVIYIGRRAFENCANLASVTVIGNPDIESDSFKNTVYQNETDEKDQRTAETNYKNTIQAAVLKNKRKDAVFKALDVIWLTIKIVFTVWCLVGCVFVGLYFENIGAGIFSFAFVVIGIYIHKLITQI